jgi:hypothetical protein
VETVGSDLACSGSGEAAVADDCGPEDPASYPGAEELPGDGIDEDCDGQELCFLDADGDDQGGDELSPSLELACTGAGLSPTSDDCDDTDASVAVGATEVVADGVDQDCDGGDLCRVDADGDGWGDPEGTTSDGDLSCDGVGEADDALDCDDGDAMINPDAEETVGDGIDGDCDGAEACFPDGDGDGFGGEGVEVVGGLDCELGGAASIGGDCDDADAAVYPGATEVVADAADQDCDGGDLCYADEDGDGVAGDGTVPSENLLCFDAGEGDAPNDCDDADAAVSPTATETCNNVDDDCDGAVDEELKDCDTTREGDLCGCASARPSWSVAGLFAAALLLRRRRG